MKKIPNIPVRVHTSGSSGASQPSGIAVRVWKLMDAEAGIIICASIYGKLVPVYSILITCLGYSVWRLNTVLNRAFGSSKSSVFETIRVNKSMNTCLILASIEYSQVFA
jgi:hypothetical protein